MHFDENFFVLVPTLLFLVLAYKPIKRLLTEFLDNRGRKIREQLEEAEALKSEAQRLLAEQKAREKAIHEEALQIISHAREEVERLQNESKAELEDVLRRREQMAFTRISLAEKEAMHSVQQFTARMTFETVSRLVKENLPESVSLKIVEDSISEAPRKLRLH